MTHRARSTARRILLAASSVVIAGHIYAGDRDWQSTNGLSWEDPANWVEGLVPTSADAVTFGSLGNSLFVQLNGAESADSLFFQNSYTLLGGTLSLSSGTIDTSAVSSATTTATIQSALAGSAGLMKTGGGVLLLAGTNSYAGPTTCREGTLYFLSAMPLGTDLVLGNDATVISAGAATLSTLNGGYNNYATFNGALTLNNDSDCAYFGALNTLGFRKTGAGVATLAADNGTGLLQLGNVDVQEGELSVVSNVQRRLGDSLHIANGASVSLTSVNIGTLSGGGTLIANAGTTITNGNVTYLPNTINISGGTFSGVFGGVGTLQFNGPMTLSGNHSAAPAAPLLTATLNSTLSIQSDYALPRDSVLFLNDSSISIGLNGHLLRVSTIGAVSTAGTINLQSGTLEIGQGSLTSSYANVSAINGPGVLRLEADNTTIFGELHGVDRLDVSGSVYGYNLIVPETALRMNNGSLQGQGMAFSSIEGSGSIGSYGSPNDMVVSGIHETTFTGTITVNSGAFILDGGGTLNFSGAIAGSGGPGANGLGIKHATLRLVGATTLSASEFAHLDANGTIDLNGQTLDAPLMVGTGHIILGNPSAAGQINLVNGTFDGSISGDGDVSLGNQNVATISIYGDVNVGSCSIGHLEATTLRSAFGNVTLGSASSVRGIDFVGSLTLNGDLVIDQTLSSDVSTISIGVASGNTFGGLHGSGTIVKRGPGTLVLNTVVGAGVDASIEEGSLVAAYPFSAASLNLYLAAGTTLSSLPGEGVNIRTIAGSGDVSVDVLSLGSSTGDSSDFYGVIHDPPDAAGVVAINTNATTFHKTQEYSGATYIASFAALLMRDGATFPPSSDVISFGTLDLGTAPQTLGSIADADGNFQGCVFAGSTLAIGANNSSTHFGGTIQVADQFTKIGIGQLILDGSSTFAAGITIDDGTLTLTGPNVVNGSILVRGVGTSVPILEADADDRLGATTTPLTLANGTLRVLNSFSTSRPILLGVGPNGGGTIDVSGTATFTVASVVSGLTGLIKLGPGTLQLTASNTYSGATNLREGTLLLSGSGALPAQSVFTMNAGATLDIGDAAHQLGSLAGAGTIQLGNSTLTFGSNGAYTTFSGAIQGMGAIHKVGPGQTTLSGPNTFQNGITVDGGTLVLASNPVNTYYGGDTQINGATLRVTTANALQGNSNVFVSSGTLQFAVPASPSPYYAPVSVLNVSGDGVVDCAANTEVGFLGDITGNGTLHKAGGGALTMYSSASLTGTLKLESDGGAVRLFGSGAFTSISQLQITRGSSVVLDNTGGTVNDRLSDSATITFDGGSLVDLPSNLGASSEMAGPLVLRSSAASINMQVVSPGTSSISFASLQRSVGATLNITGVAIGTTNRVLFRTAPGSIGAWLKVNGLSAKYDATAGLVPTTFPMPGPSEDLPWGDTNFDGRITRVDYATTMNDMGMMHATWGQGDFNRDGLVDAQDMNLLLSNAPSIDSVVPEPLVIWTVVAMFFKRRRPIGCRRSIVASRCWTSGKGHLIRKAASPWRQESRAIGSQHCQSFTALQ